MHALVNVFAENGWTGFSFGVFFVEGKKIGKIELYKVKDGKVTPRKEQIKCWEIWKNKMEDKK